MVPLSQIGLMSSEVAVDSVHANASGLQPVDSRQPPGTYLQGWDLQGFAQFHHHLSAQQLPSSVDPTGARGQLHTEICDFTEMQHFKAMLEICGITPRTVSFLQDVDCNKKHFLQHRDGSVCLTRRQVSYLDHLFGMTSKSSPHRGESVLASQVMD